MAARKRDNARKAGARAKASARRAPARRRPAATAGRRRAKQRAAKPAVRSVARKRAAKPAVRSAAGKRAAKPAVRSAAGKRALKPAVRSAARTRAARPASRASRKRFEPAFAKQKAGASPKELLLFELQRARVAVQAAVQGLPAGAAGRPIAAGKWSPHEIVLHLVARDRVRLEEFSRVLAGGTPSWWGVDESRQAAMNEFHLSGLRSLSWEDALRTLQNARADLMAALIAVPSEPSSVWERKHPFGAMMYALPDHDRHHADQIRDARLAGG